ncbi:hypothetical protein [Streptomyces sp. NPDC054794]
MSTQALVGIKTRAAHRGREDHSGLWDSIRRRPLTRFFSLAHLLSWAVWTLYVLPENGRVIGHASNSPETPPTAS